MHALNFAKHQINKKNLENGELSKQEEAENFNCKELKSDL